MRRGIGLPAGWSDPERRLLIWLGDSATPIARLHSSTPKRSWAMRTPMVKSSPPGLASSVKGDNVHKKGRTNMPDGNDIEARRQAREEREQNAVQSAFTAIAYQPTAQQEQQTLSWVKHFAYETRQADHKEQEQDLRERLQRLGVEVSLAHYTGDSSSPTEYELIFGPVRVAGPTMDLAVTAFLQYWIERFGVEALSRSGAHPLYRLGERREESEE